MEVGEVSVPSEKITTFDDSPVPRKRNARRTYDEQLAAIPDESKKSQKRRLRSVAHRLADMEIPRYWKHVEKNGKTPSLRPQQ